MHRWPPPATQPVFALSGRLTHWPQSAPGYKALVCIFMFGGNDSNNTLVPFDTTANGTNGYTAYSNIRGPLAIPAASLLTLGSQANGNYGLHPSLPNIQSTVQQQQYCVCRQCGHPGAAADSGAISGWIGADANQPLFSSRPAIGVAKRSAERGHQYWLGRANRRQHGCHLQSRRTDSPDHIRFRRHAVLQRCSEFAGGRQSRQSARRCLQ